MLATVSSLALLGVRDTEKQRHTCDDERLTESGITTNRLVQQLLYIN